MKKNKPIQVFFADDDADDRWLFEETLTDAKIDAALTTFENGKKLIDHLQTDQVKPDVIFLDINMPVMTGHECLKHIRCMKNMDTVPVIMFSTSTRCEDIKNAYENGANVYVAKPVFFKDNVTALNTIFSVTWKTDLLKQDRALFILSSATQFSQFHQ